MRWRGEISMVGRHDIEAEGQICRSWEDWTVKFLVEFMNITSCYINSCMS